MTKELLILQKSLQNIDQEKLIDKISDKMLDTLNYNKEDVVKTLFDTIRRMQTSGQADIMDEVINAFTGCTFSELIGEIEADDDEHYCPSSTAGDYAPGCPWNAPGMSIRDFI